MKAIFAPGHLQSDLHLESNYQRLACFIELLNGCGINEIFPSRDQLQNEIAGASLIIATSRKYDFEQNELDTLVNAIKGGVPLLHLSNHTNNMPNGISYPIFDSQLAKKFGYRFEETYFENQQKKQFEVKFDLDTLPGWQNKLGKNLTVVIKNCSSIEILDNRFIIIAKLPVACFDKKSPQNKPIDEIFAIACEKTVKSGRIVALSDSGLIGKPYTTQSYHPYVPDIDYPGPGLDAGENLSIMREIINWLVEKPL